MALMHANGKTPASPSPRKGARLIGVGGPAEVIPHHSANELLPCIFGRRGGGRNKGAPFLLAKKVAARVVQAPSSDAPPNNGTPGQGPWLGLRTARHAVSLWDRCSLICLVLRLPYRSSVQVTGKAFH